MTQPCPRQRQEAVMQVQRNHVSHWEADGTCSYCGSISPQMFFNAIDEGCKITPTDKSYKIYVDLPPTGKERVFSSQWSVEQPSDKHIEATEEVCKRLNWEPWGLNNPRYQNEKMWVTVGIDDYIFAKFYFQHLNQAERDKFIEAHNQKRLNLAHPGYFYVLPYFCNYVVDP